jgi:hypothetical protein
MVLAIRRGKHETRRVANDNPRSPWYRGGCAYHVTRPRLDRFEKTYAICPGRGKQAVGRLKLTKEPELTVVENITDAGAIAEGFESRDAFLDYFLRLNRGVDLKTEVWAIRFAVVFWHEPQLLAMLKEAT